MTQTSHTTSTLPSQGQKLRSLFMGGILPVIIFTGIENYFGTLWGLCAGMIFGLGEIIWEWRKQGKVDPLTLGGNGMLLVLGGISLFTQEGIWFKLQPSLMEGLFAFFLWGSVFLKKPVLLALMQKQGGLPANLDEHFKPGVGAVVKSAFSGFTLRLGLFLAVHSGIAAWAAFYWSSAAWAALKGIGLTLSLIVYLVVESLVLRYRISSI